MVKKKVNPFYFQSGKAVTSLKSLAKELREMSSDIYDHHVNPAKNDFSNWIRNSLEERNLADKIDGQISKIELELEVLRHILMDEVKPISKKKSSGKKQMPKVEVSKPLVKKTAKKTISKKK